MGDETKKPQDPRVILLMPSAMLTKIDDYRRRAPNLPSRSEAIRDLVEAGLKALANEK